MMYMIIRHWLQQRFPTHSIKWLLSLILFCLVQFDTLNAQKKGAGSMFLNKQEYLEYQGVNVMLAHDFYPEGHQGGVGIIQNDQRVATNGDIRLEPTPGQWSPIPKVGK